MTYSWLAAEASGIRFGALAIVLFLAVTVPLVLRSFKRVRIPVVVGEILAGIVVGQSGLGWVPAHDFLLDLLAEIGFVMLMFLAGMEIDFQAAGIRLGRQRGSNEERSRASGPTPLRLALEHFGLTVLLALGAGYLLWRWGLTKDIYMMAFILSTTSLGVVMPILKENNLLGTRYGQTLLVTALIADFAAMFLITIRVAVLSHGITLDILLIGLLFVALFVLYRIGVSVLPGLRPLLDELSQATTPLKLRLAFLILTAFVALSELLGVEVILGAFLAGLLISLLREPEDHAIQHQIESLGYGFFIPIFFVMVGVRFDLSVLAQARNLWVVPTLIGLALAVKVIPSVVFRQLFSWRESLAAGLFLAAHLSLVIAAGEVAYSLGVFDKAMVNAIVLLAIFTAIFTPWAFLTLIGPRLAAQPSRTVVVVGLGPVGIQVLEQLHGHRDPVIGLDEDEQRVRRAQQRHLPAQLAQPTPEAASALERAATVVITLTDPERTLKWAQLARHIFGVERVFALNANAQTIPTLQSLGVHPITPLEAQATFIALMVRNPDLVYLMTATRDQRDVREVVVRNPALEGVRLRDVGLPPEVLVLAIHREDEHIIPRGDTRLRLGDVLTLLGTHESLAQAAQRLGAAESTGD
ncbi:MAG: hypothetical protein GXO54_03285 [Chloroflexi bacterium]|nr:hypothetical protein [Chloroflexota bacterium]